MAQGLSNPQRYRGFVLTVIGLQKLHDRIQQLESQTRLRQSPRSIAERIQLNESDGIHSTTVRKILDGQNGVDKRSIQLVFQVLQLPLEEGDYAHAGLCLQSSEASLTTPPEPPSEASIEVPTEASEVNASVARHQDWSEVLDDSNFHGRIHETAQLKQVILSERCRLIQILGMAGIGKTSFATMLTRAIQSEFEFVLWKSLHHAPTVQTVLSSLLRSLIQHPKRNIELPTDVETLTGLLIEQLQNHRCLLVFDHFDSILCTKQYAGYYRPGYEAYRELLQVIAEVSHQSCLIITSREKPRFVGMAAEHYCRSLQLNGLTDLEGQQMFNSIANHVGQNAAHSVLQNYSTLFGNQDDWRSLVQQWDGNPLVLKMVAGYIQNYFNGSISDYLQYLEPGKLLCSDLRDLFRQQFDRLSPLEQELAWHLASCREPISVTQFREKISSSIHHHNCLEGLDSLGRRSLLQKQGNDVALNSLMKLYINECLTEQRDSASVKRKLEIVPQSHTVA